MRMAIKNDHLIEDEELITCQIKLTACNVILLLSLVMRLALSTRHYVPFLSHGM